MIINGFLFCIGAVIALVIIGAIWQSITTKLDKPRPPVDRLEAWKQFVAGNKRRSK